MKNLFKGLFITAALIFATTSCEEKYEDTTPTDLNLTDLVSSVRTEVGSNYQFTLTLGGGYDRATLTFVGAKSSLEAGAYTPATKDAATAGNYVTGLTFINGVAAESGTINVTQDGANYAIDAKLLCGGREISVKWAGELTYAEVLPAVTFDTLMEAKHSLPDAELLTITLSAGEFDWTAGNGTILTLDLYSKDGLLPEGIYKASAKAGEAKEGQFGIGHMVEEESWGQVVKNAKSSTLITYEGWQATPQLLTDGIVIVQGRGENKYNIEVIASNVHAVFEGEIELTKYVKPADPSELQVVIPKYLATDEVTTGEGYDLHKITVSDAEGNVVATFEALTESGAESLAGAYTVQGYPNAPGLMGNGWIWGDNGGGTTFIVEGEKYLVQSGTVNVIQGLNGAYEFSAEAVASTKTDYTTPGPAAFSFGVTFGEELPTQFTKLSSYTDNTEAQQILTLQFNTDGVTPTVNGWTTTWSGTGAYFKTDIYCADGTLAAGTYVASATGGVVGANEFGIGYDYEDWGEYGKNWGTCWFDITEGVVGEGKKITEGTITVEVDDDGNYTLYLYSEAAEALYEGPIAPLQ